VSAVEHRLLSRTFGYGQFARIYIFLQVVQSMCIHLRISLRCSQGVHVADQFRLVAVELLQVIVFAQIASDAGRAVVEGLVGRTVHSGYPRSNRRLAPGLEAGQGVGSQLKHLARLLESVYVAD
jgi:hypothetical protein